MGLNLRQAPCQQAARNWENSSSTRSGSIAVMQRCFSSTHSLSRQPSHAVRCRIMSRVPASGSQLPGLLRALITAATGQSTAAGQVHRAGVVAQVDQRKRSNSISSPIDRPTGGIRKSAERRAAIRGDSPRAQRGCRRRSREACQRRLKPPARGHTRPAASACVAVFPPPQNTR